MKKVFISYSHKDEAHKEDLEEHLSMLKRNGVISVWHDRKILAGQDWKDQIDQNLEEADIVVFLISPSFLASDYCYDKEVKRAMEKHDEGSAQIISVIVRDCDWNECEFSRFQAVPKDARPITLWDNRDTAWLDAVKGIRAHIESFTAKKKDKALANIDEDGQIQPSPSVLEWLEDTEISLTHRKVNKIKVSDIYVVPDLDHDSDGKSQPEGFINIRCASKVVDESVSYIISGEEQQGKTSLLKYYYIELLKKGFLPIYLDAKDVNKSDIDLVLSKAVSEQYLNLSCSDFLCSDKKIVLLDNIDYISLNPRYRQVFLSNLNDIFQRSIITCHLSFRFVYSELPELDYHCEAEILGLGNKKREDLVKKWISLGVEESIEDHDLYSQCDDLKARLDTVIKKNIVPSKPIYVLMLLQMFEANAQLNLELTSYGHCYQQLIYQSFDKAKINKTDFEKYLNVLTELAWWIFKNEKEPNENELTEFFEGYCSSYLSVDRSLVMRKLLGHSILKDSGFNTGFKYPYIYYYFVGKKIAESYSDSETVKEEVRNLLSLMHREDYANILIFITHHTKDSWVLNEIQDVLDKLFKDHAPATLEKKTLQFMDEFMKRIPDLVLEQREIQNERDRHNEHLDDIERNLDLDEIDQSYDDGAPDILANINKAFKGMEIAGQIIRNRHASLTKESLLHLANSGATTGLRFLEYFINISDASKNEIIKVISLHLAEYPYQSDKEIERLAEHAYLHLTYGVVNGVVRKIAASIGSKEAREIYRFLEERADTPAFYLISQAIDLQFNKVLKVQNVSKCKEKLRDNPVCVRILKEMIVQHIYMFPVDYKEKQQLSELLGISVQGQRIMDQRKIGKGA